MIDAVIPYTLPEVNDHSFFFIAQHVSPAIEAKMHRHEAWELYYVTFGQGIRMTGDTVLPFATGDVVLIPPSMPHYWKYDSGFTDSNGEISYLMAAFSPEFIDKCISSFPEIRNCINGRSLPSEALKYGHKSSAAIKQIMRAMAGIDDIGQLGKMLRLLTVIFTAKDHTSVGRDVKIGRDIRRMHQVVTYVMAHYIHNITLDDIASHIGMNRSAFCTFFKRDKNMTFSQFVTRYRLETARELLASSQKQISEICVAVGFNDLPHFSRMFKKEYGMSPSKYRDSLSHKPIS